MTNTNINQILLDQINVLAKTQEQAYIKEDFGMVIDIAETITVITASLKREHKKGENNGCADKTE